MQFELELVLHRLSAYARIWGVLVALMLVDDAAMLSMIFC